MTVASEWTTPTTKEWLLTASSAPALQNPSTPFDVALHFPCSRATCVWIDTSALLATSRENMLEQGKVTSWKAFFFCALSEHMAKGGLLLLCYLRRGTHKQLYLEAWPLSYKISPFQRSHRSKAWHQTCSAQVCSNQSQLVMDTKHPRHRTLGGPSVGFYSSACTNHSPGRQPHYLSCPF